MRTIVITPPDTKAALSLDDVRRHLRIDDGFTDDDLLIEAYRDAAFAHLDGPAGWLGRALAPQVLEVQADGFYGCGLYSAIALPYRPVTAITSITWLDSEGADQVLAAEGYDLVGDYAVAPAHGESWPSGRSRPGAVRIRYAAGSADPIDPMWMAVRAALLLMIGDLYRFRETVAVGLSATPIAMSATVEKLLSPHRIWSL